MVDCDRDRLVTQDKPLYEQKFDGFSFRDSDQAFLERRSRRLHRTNVPYPTQSTRECMAPGRHYNMYSNVDLVTLYYGWCPFDEGGIARKLQIQTQIPLIDRQLNRGFHHITNKETLTWRLETEFVPRARNIAKEIESNEMRTGSKLSRQVGIKTNKKSISTKKESTKKSKKEEIQVGLVKLTEEIQKSNDSINNIVKINKTFYLNCLKIITHNLKIQRGIQFVCLWS